MYLGPNFPAFSTLSVLQFLLGTLGIKLIGTAEKDLTNSLK